MKTLITFSTHSFVDLITNSSSELFVCDTQKTVEMVREILKKILDTHNEINDLNYDFDEVFGLIEVCEFGFDYNDLDEGLRREYEKYHSRPGNWNYNPMGQPEYKKIWQKQQDMMKGVKLPAYDDKNPESIKIREEYENKRRALWEPYWKLESEASANLDKHILEKYNLENKYDSVIFTAFSYGIKLKKGQVLISSRSDNTIPYELFDQIESVFHGERYHIG